MAYEFSEHNALGWMQHIGVHVRPPIEMKLEERHFQEFSTRARERFPQLFDRMVIGDKQFEMLKTFVVPGKAEAEARTFVMSPRGPVFSFPKRIAQIELEPDLPNTNETFSVCMKQFKKDFPTRKIVRVGSVNEYIFDCGDNNAVKLVAETFTKLAVPDDGELQIRSNFCDTDHNRIITIEPLTRMKQQDPHIPPVAVGFAVKVTVDFNNRILRDDMTQSDWLTILTSADLFVRDEMYAILNRENHN